MKRCAKCGQDKRLEEYSQPANSKRTFNSYCKSCQRDFCRAHYLANKDKHNKRRYLNQRRYHKRNQVFILGYLLEHPCADCGEKDPLYWNSTISRAIRSGTSAIW